MPRHDHTDILDRHVTAILDFLGRPVTDTERLFVRNTLECCLYEGIKIGLADALVKVREHLTSRLADPHQP